MDVYSAVTLGTLIVFLFLLVAVLRDVGTRIRKLFIVYLIVSAVWSLIAFIVYSKYFPGLLSYWGSIIPIIGLWSIISYFHFVSAFRAFYFHCLPL